jgi:hypothetical protein
MTAALALLPPIDLAPWRISRYDFLATVEAAAREVAGANCETETLTEALRRFGYQRSTIKGVRGVARNGVMKRPDRGPHDWANTWIWLARVKRRIEGRRG